MRRALDYVFSLRLDLMYGNANGEDDGAVRTFDNTWAAGTLQGIVSLNNLRWNVGERKNNLYALAGFGLNSFSVDMEGDGGPINIDNDVAAHADVGAGIAFRINERVNFGIEHKATFIFGDRADLLDGIQTVKTDDERRTLRDVANYTSVRLNINIGNMSEQTEPLYWVNPMEDVINDLTLLKDSRVTLTDSDGDGVIDMLDDEENTAEGAYVDSRGVTLDSDSDGVPNHIDQEPFSQPGYQVDGNGVAQVPDVEAELRKYVDERLKNFQPVSPTATAPTASASGIYLPNIYFGSNGARVSGRHFGTLGSVATVLKSEPALRLVVTGHTDASGNEEANLTLSYNRAKNTIDQLVEKFGIGRDRLVLQYKGESELLLPNIAEINRRVEFSVANGETEMAPPAANK